MDSHITPSLRPPEAGDNARTEIFELLYGRFFSRLVRHLRPRVPGRAAAEDIAQETLVRAFVKLEQYDPSRPMWPWIRAISRGILADHGPRLRPDVPVEPPDRAVIQPELASVEDRAVLSEALAKLPHRHRQAVGLRYIEDRSPRHAAATMGLNVTAFNQLLFRARKRLREEYQRLTDGLPAALSGLGWLVPRWRRLRRAARQRAAELSSATWSESLSKTTGTAVALLMFSLLPPIGLRTSPAQATAPPRETYAVYSKAGQTAQPTEGMATHDLPSRGTEPTRSYPAPESPAPEERGVEASGDSATPRPLDGQETDGALSTSPVPDPHVAHTHPAPPQDPDVVHKPPVSPQDPDIVHFRPLSSPDQPLPVAVPPLGQPVDQVAESAGQPASD